MGKLRGAGRQREMVEKTEIDTYVYSSLLETKSM